ncbi:hypothetical protein PM082_003835 [Marasmius tenuissimus]|nr:hypothetical protein PM082_003835 [Marasmius tenuissimus]
MKTGTLTGSTLPFLYLALVSKIFGFCTAAPTTGTHQARAAAESSSPESPSHSTQVRNIMVGVFGGVVPLVGLIAYFYYRETSDQRTAVKNKKLAARPWTFHWPSAAYRSGESSAPGLGTSSSASPDQSSSSQCTSSPGRGVTVPRSEACGTGSSTVTSVNEHDPNHRAFELSLRGESSSIIGEDEYPKFPPPPYSSLTFQV